MTPAIRALEAAEAEARLGELADILVDAVAHGASVNFMAGFTADEGRAFWRNQLPGIADGREAALRRRRRRAAHGDRVADLRPSAQRAAPRRDRQDARPVLGASAGSRPSPAPAAEEAARAAGRTLLMLDTETGSAGDRLYRSCGWTEIGSVPDHAFRPDGRLAETTLFYKKLG